MAQAAIREFDAKRLMSRYMRSDTKEFRSVLVDPETDLEKLERKFGWLKDSKLVVKPDQLFGKRGKHGLVGLKLDLSEVKKWIKEKMGKSVKIGKVEGVLTHFLIESFTPHESEYYVAIKSEREGDRIYFSRQGGVEIEENWENVSEVLIPVLKNIDDFDLKKVLNLPDNFKKEFEEFIRSLFKFYAETGFVYLEINPFTFLNGEFVLLDTVARVDDTAVQECGSIWGNLEFPAPFGRELSKEEQSIAEMDEKTGASLKLTVLNPEGRIWTMVAGGGASVIFADTICDLGGISELANYGEYSGDPNTNETYQYASMILDLMTKKKNKHGKVLLIGGGIANFTDVAKTFKGIIMALTDYAKKLRENNVKIYVRRGGPNYERGLSEIKLACEALVLPIEVYGPETHMTRIVGIGMKE